MKNILSRRFPLHIKIFIGMFVGIFMGIGALWVGGEGWVLQWIKPWGDIFVRMLKMVAIPVVLFSLIDGISNLKGLSGLSRIGTKTLGLYILTTVLAIGVGLAIVNGISPGRYLPEERRNALKEQYTSSAQEKLLDSQRVKGSGPLQPIVDIVPDNFPSAASSNRNMLQIIFAALIFGIAMVMLPEKRVQPIKDIVHSLHSVFLQIVGIIMRLAPYGVCALLMSLLVELVGERGDIWSLFKAMGAYVISVLLSLAVLIFVVYPLAIRVFTGKGYMSFLRGILPAQLLAFGTSSSVATLPATMRCVEKNIGVSEEVSSFVLPIGATINMDGTSIHQAVSAVFIAQAFGHDLTMGDQLTIVLTATLSSIGAAAVPGAGLIMLVIVLSAIGIDPEGLALIIALDRPLDMCRTAVNVTGDATVASLIAKSEGETLLPASAKEKTKGG